ncbi:glycosyltransferase [Microvirga puerhi]|uniref:Glycosyltransferase n=1 Tax=Microvirga puerhi TaxID=2876078 RepID=A0ABS7VMA1_9HYPH|nr:glycosyltransferase [Microvirga puerhi]MBZ6076291.1 glycosyltransferase [Microvirga puerhi]
MRVYHATEDYLSPSDGLSVSTLNVQAPLKRLLHEIDLLVSVSEGVAHSYEAHGGYRGASIVLRNGCDFPFWRDSRASDYTPPADARPVALFQGALNSRLDYDLLLELVDSLPDWHFWFCGKTVDAPPGWNKLLARPNVRHFGSLAPAAIADLARQSSVGLIPFRQDALMRRSLPLKAYEYVACGLPVVTIPIDALGEEPHLFSFARNAREFADAMVLQATTRTDPARIEERLIAASQQSYDERFAQLKSELLARLELRRNGQSLPQGNLLVLYDDRSLHVRTIEEHLVAFRTYSRHHILFMPATGFIQGLDDAPDGIDLSLFDAVAIHYSIRLSIPDHLSKAVAASVSAYNGPKLLFIQDEYDATETARQWIERLGIDAVFTTVPDQFVDAIYPRSRFPNVEFLPTLTGYVPEDRTIDSYAKPIEERDLLIGYRGRRLPHHYGDLGQEKLNIGIEIRQLARKMGLNVDIEVDDTRRIYGNDWYRFLGSCRATLGTESGSNVFDFDGSLAKLSTEFADLPYADFSARYLSERDGKIRMNQISPKIFEAIRLRTALVLFEGEYSGVVEADRHYIPLKKDYSNFSEVVRKLEDVDYLRDLTDRAYDEIIRSGRYSYAAFVAGVDAYLDRRFDGRTKGALLLTPSLGIFANSGQAEDRGGADLSCLFMTNTVLKQRLTPDDYRHLVTNLTRLSDQYLDPNFVNMKPSLKSIILLTGLWLWTLLPKKFREYISGRVSQKVRELRAAGPSHRFVRLAVKWMPQRLRNMLRYHIR